MRRAHAFLSVCTTAGIASHAIAQPTFTLLEQPATSIQSGSVGLSADGSRVAGTFRPGGGYSAFVWDSSTGVNPIEGPTGSTRSLAFGISGNGNTVAGMYATAAHNSAQNSAFMWSEATGSVALPLLPGASSFVGAAYGVSGDGSVVTGVLRNSAGQMRAVYWKDVGAPVDIARGTAMAASADGSIIAGFDPFGGDKSFIWSESGGLTMLTPPAFYSSNSPVGISADGSVVVGTMSSPVFGTTAYRWTQATGMVAIPYVTGWERGVAGGVSADGRVVVGQLQPFDIVSTDPEQAFYWSEATGSVTLRSLLGDAVDDEWRLIDARGVSADGYTVTGVALNDITGERRAFYAVIPAPSSLALCMVGLTAFRRRSR